MHCIYWIDCPCFDLNTASQGVWVYVWKIICYLSISKKIENCDGWDGWARARKHFPTKWCCFSPNIIQPVTSQSWATYWTNGGWAVFSIFLWVTLDHSTIEKINYQIHFRFIAAQELYVDILKTLPKELALTLFDSIKNVNVAIRSHFVNSLIKWQNESIQSVDENKFDVPAISTVPTEKKKNPAFVLSQVLKTRSGKCIQAQYDTHDCLEDSFRSELIMVIVRYLYENDLSLSPTEATKIVKQITKVFPNESEVIFILTISFDFIVVSLWSASSFLCMT